MQSITKAIKQTLLNVWEHKWKKKKNLLCMGLEGKKGVKEYFLQDLIYLFLEVWECFSCILVGYF